MRRLTVLVVLFFPLWPWPSGYGHDVVTTSITWNRVISLIVSERCASCHSEKGKAFSLTTYAEARPWAVAIKEEVLSRRMPPWGAVRGFGEFRNDRSLTQEQLELITSWVDGGVPEGDEKDKLAKPPASAHEESIPRLGEIRVKGDFALNRAFTLDGLLLETAAEKASFRITADLPDGSVAPLLWLYEYQRSYAHPFLLKNPLELPARTVIRGVPPGAELVLLPH
jgi:hypothetical protein